MVANQIDITSKEVLQVLMCCYYIIHIWSHLDEKVNITSLLLFTHSDGSKQAHSFNPELFSQLRGVLLEHRNVFLC